MPDGSTTTYTIPSGKAIVITNINLDYVPNVQDSRQLKFVIGKSPYNLIWYSNAYDRIWWNFFPMGPIGIAISDSNNLKIQVLDYTTGALFPGSMEFRIYGYHTSLTSSINAPVNYLLFSKNNSSVYPFLTANIRQYHRHSAPG